MKIDSKKQNASRAHASATCYVENEIASRDNDSATCYPEKINVSREAFDYLNNIWCLQKHAVYQTIDHQDNAHDLNKEDLKQDIDQKLKLYIELLLKWNKTINLIARSTESNIYERHILDSLQLMDLVGDKNIHLADLGSGAGLPGIILSIAGVKQVSLIESDVRKATFLRQASQLSDNIIHVKNERLENINDHFDLITARAFAELKQILALSKHLRCNRYLLLKGKKYQYELDEAQLIWQFDYDIYNSTTDPEGKIIDIRNIRVKND